MTPTPTKSPRPQITGAQIAEVREWLELDVPTMAIALGVSTATVYRWESTANAGAYAAPQIRRALAMLIAALHDQPPATLKRLGHKIRAYCLDGQSLEAHRCLVVAATKVKP